MGFNFFPCGNLAGCLAKPSWSCLSDCGHGARGQTAGGWNCLLSVTLPLAGPGLGSKVWKNPLRLEMRYGGQCSG